MKVLPTAAIQAVLARCPGPAALLAATPVGPLLPAAVWYHYLAVLLPFLVLAIGHAGLTGRAIIPAGGALIVAGIGVPALATMGAFVLVAGAWAALWPMSAAIPGQRATGPGRERDRPVELPGWPG